MKQAANVHYHHPVVPQQIVIDAGGVPGTIIFPDFEPATVGITDARQLATPLRFASDALEFARAPIESAWLDDLSTGHYDRSLEALLKSRIGAQEVRVFDHTIRRDDGSKRPPARHVHGDYNHDSAHQRLRDILGDVLAEDWSSGHFAIVNTWRPIGEPVKLAPLAFVTPKSIDAGDWIDVDLVYPNRRGKVQGLARNDDHEWVYLSEMTPDEIAMFTVFDNRTARAVGHSAVDFVDAPKTGPIRQSIESRILVRFADATDPRR